MKPSICIYCGSSPGASSEYSRSAALLGRELAVAGINLIYGGGGSGIMGAVARAAVSNGAEVVGVVPEALVKSAEGFEILGTHRVVTDYHERKALMSQLAHGFAVLPGGLGTLEELAEQLTWAELQRHEKPIYVMNTNRYWERSLELFLKMQHEAFMAPGMLTRYVVVETAEELVSHFMDWWRRSGKKSKPTV